MKTSAYSGEGINVLFEKLGEAILDPNQKFQIRKQEVKDKLDNNNNSNKKENKNNSNNFKEIKKPKKKNIKLSKQNDKKNDCC